MQKLIRINLPLYLFLFFSFGCKGGLDSQIPLAISDCTTQKVSIAGLYENGPEWYSGDDMIYRAPVMLRAKGGELRVRNYENGVFMVAPIRNHILNACEKCEIDVDQQRSLYHQFQASMDSVHGVMNATAFGRNLNGNSPPFQLTSVNVEMVVVYIGRFKHKIRRPGKKLIERECPTYIVTSFKVVSACR